MNLDNTVNEETNESPKRRGQWVANWQRLGGYGEGYEVFSGMIFEENPNGPDVYDPNNPPDFSYILNANDIDRLRDRTGCLPHNANDIDRTGCLPYLLYLGMAGAGLLILYNYLSG